MKTKTKKTMTKSKRRRITLEVSKENATNVALSDTKLQTVRRKLTVKIREIRTENPANTARSKDTIFLNAAF